MSPTTRQETLETAGPETLAGAPSAGVGRRQGRRPRRAGKAAAKKAAVHAVPFKVRWRRDWQMVLMMVPGVLVMLLFAYIPILGNVIAFQDYQPYLTIFEAPFVGLEKFVGLFDDPAFLDAFRNTIVLAVTQLVLFFPVPIILALVVDSLSPRRIRNVFQSIVYLPHFLSWVLVITFFQEFLGGAGFINNTLKLMGMGSIPFMTDPATFPLMATIQLVWKDAGWAMIIFLAALATVDVALYEAAAADGAGRWRRLWHVTLPALRPVIILLLILRIGDILSVGFEQFILQRDNVGPGAAEVLDTYVYYSGVIGGDWSAGAAAGLAKGVVSALLIWGANSLAHKFGEAGLFQKKVG
jgi:putative aldouronate transport system permease protein